jgi:hypothetical protein
VTPGGGVWGDSFADNGVVGSSVNGNGVYGLAGNGVGVAAFSTYNYAVKATSTNEDGVHAQTSHNSSATGTGYSGVFGQDVSSDGGHLNVGVAGWSTNGVGVSALSSNWVGANVSGGQGNGSGGKDYPALSVVGNGSFDLIDACSQGTNPCNASSSGGFGPAVFELTYFGRINMAGSIFTGGSCASGCLPTPTTGEKRVRFYTAQESLPTVEDFGDAQLINGQAYVHIDPAFANTMDQRAHYMVFVTPEGDSRGLYVTQKTLTGFAVHENQGGRSTLAFSYRIIAKPYGDQSMRLQMFTMAKPRANRARSL